MLLTPSLLATLKYIHNMFVYYIGLSYCLYVILTCELCMRRLMQGSCVAQWWGASMAGWRQGESDGDGGGEGRDGDGDWDGAGAGDRLWFLCFLCIMVLTMITTITISSIIIRLFILNLIIIIFIFVVLVIGRISNCPVGRIVTAIIIITVIMIISRTEVINQ